VMCVGSGGVSRIVSTEGNTVNTAEFVSIQNLIISMHLRDVVGPERGPLSSCKDK
jgi:hypothetical protein